MKSLPKWRFDYRIKYKWIALGRIILPGFSQRWWWLLTKPRLRYSAQTLAGVMALSTYLVEWR